MRKALLIALFLLMMWLLPLRYTIAQAPPTTPEAHAKAREQLREIMARPEFSVATSTPQRPLQRIADWIKKRWETFTNWFSKLFSATSKIASNPLFVWLFIGLFLVLGGRLILSLWTNRDRQKALNNAPLAFVEDTEVFLSSEEWLERAKTFAKESDWIQAYRALFIATLLLLDTAHFIPFEKHRTNGEYLHLLAKLPLLYPLLAPAIWQFDTHRYGGRTVSQSDYSHSLALYEKLIPLTTNPTRGQVTAEAE